MNQPVTNQIKYPSFVLAVDAAPLKKILIPNILDDKPMWWLNDLGGEHVWEETKPNSPRINAHLVIRQRQLLERTRAFLQLLPYTLIGYVDALGVARLTTYFRKKGEGGEERLDGNMSFGWGGHIEMVDLAWMENGDLDLELTLLNNILRELEEECKFIDTRTGEEVSVHTLVNPNTLTAKGFIYDDRNPKNEDHPVGMYHLALVNLLILPDYIKVVKREKEHLQGEVLTVEQIDADIAAFEPWSEIIVASHYRNQFAVHESVTAWRSAHTEAEYHQLAVAAGQDRSPAESPATVVQEKVLSESIVKDAAAITGGAVGDSFKSIVANAK